MLETLAIVLNYFLVAWRSVCIHAGRIYSSSFGYRADCDRASRYSRSTVGLNQSTFLSLRCVDFYHGFSLLIISGTRATLPRRSCL